MLLHVVRCMSYLSHIMEEWLKWGKDTKMFRVLCFQDARKKDEVTQWLQNQAYNHFVVVVFVFFSVRLLSVLQDHSFFSSPPQRPITSDFEGFLYQILSITFIFPFECSVLNKGTTGTIFITFLVWRGPWLGIDYIIFLSYL